MTVKLTDKVYNEGGSPVQGAVAQAVLTNGTTTNVVATDTTDTKGIWAFDSSIAGHQADLADPASGFWYDVQINVGMQYRLRYGAIKAMMNMVYMANNIVLGAAQLLDTSLGAFRAPVRAADPTASGTGHLVYRSDTKALRVWDGAAWQTVPVTVPAASIPVGTITSAMIVDATIVGGDIAPNTITSANILDATIATIDLADGSVTTPKLGPNLTVTGTLTTTGRITSGTDMLVTGSVLYLHSSGDTSISRAAAGVLATQGINTSGPINSGGDITLPANSLLRFNGAGSQPFFYWDGNFLTSAGAAISINPANTANLVNQYANLRTGQASNAGFSVQINGKDSSTSQGLHIQAGTGGTNEMMMWLTDKGTASSMYWRGDRYIWANRAIDQSSGRAIKEDIRDIRSALELVRKIKGVNFRYTEKYNEHDRRSHHGFIAEDLAEILPDIVTEGTWVTHEDGTVEQLSPGVAYTELIPLLTEAIKQLDARVDALEAK